ncbi:MAG: putative ubiquinone biosynthesis protein [Gammaproteobacteria bacterium]|jgi:ubiquinone biosynthesis monooxygenase Coq7|nr:putative ubiquinone biosynthesis protein [Gammaproteobacteria bacterium]
MRQLTFIDRVLGQVHQALELSLQKPAHTTRENPALHLAEPMLSPHEIKHAAALMRINHAGEIAAQGLYQGQALTARLPNIRKQMEQAALEEIDHLVWCRERLEELGSHTSYLDPIWYLGAVLIGAAAGLAGDQWSLGFIAETEHQVSAHLQNHLEKLPEEDKKSERILTQMKIDEEQHAENALKAGGVNLPAPIKLMMRVASKVMVKTAYHF